MDVCCKMCGKDDLYSLNYFGTFLKNQLTINMWSNSGFCSVNHYVFPYAKNLDYCSLNQVVQEFQLCCSL